MNVPSVLFSAESRAHRSGFARHLKAATGERRVLAEELLAATEACLVEMARGRLQHDPARLLSPRYQQGVMTNLLRKERARLARSPQLSRPDQVVDVTTLNSVAITRSLERRAFLLRVVERLLASLDPRPPPDQLEMFAAWRAGTPVQEIAAWRGLSPDAVRMRVQRVRARLVRAWRTRPDVRAFVARFLNEGAFALGNHL